MSTPLAKRCYVMSESDGPNNRYRLIIGFETLDDLQNAHEFVANGRLESPAQETEVVRSVQRAIGDCERNGGHEWVTGPGDRGGTGDGRICAKGCGAVEQF